MVGQGTMEKNKRNKRVSIHGILRNEGNIKIPNGEGREVKNASLPLIEN
jgi:hypothetical protein